MLSEEAIVIILIFFILLLIYKGSGCNETESMGNLGSNCMCPQNYNPIVCNGKFYNNKCKASCAGEDITKCGTSLTI